jgi:hypothetical protein
MAPPSKLIEWLHGLQTDVKKKYRRKEYHPTGINDPVPGAPAVTFTMQTSLLQHYWQLNPKRETERERYVHSSQKVHVTSYNAAESFSQTVQLKAWSVHPQGGRH